MNIALEMKPVLQIIQIIVFVQNLVILNSRKLVFYVSNI